MIKSPRLRWVLILLLLGLAAGLRFHEIGRKAIWFDEGATLGMARLPILSFLRELWDPYLNNQAVYYVLYRPWHAMGESEAMVRAFSALFSVASVAVVVELGRRIFGASAGLVAGAILTLHAASIRYAQEARAYSLTMFLVCLSALFLWRFVSDGRKRDAVAWSVAGGLAMYSHFFAMFAVGAQAVALLALGWSELKARRPLWAAVLGLALLALPIVLFSAHAPIQAISWIAPVDASGLAYVATFLAGGRAFLLVFALALFASAVPRVIRDGRPMRRFGLALGLSWAVLPFLAMVAVSELARPILLDRYLLASVPAWALTLAGCLGPLIERRSLAPVGLALAAFVLVSEAEAVGTVYQEPFEDWRTPAARVAAATRPGDAIVFEGPWAGLAFGYYLDRAGQRPAPLQPGPLIISAAFDEEKAAACERVWVVLSREDEARAGRIHRLLSLVHPIVSGFDFGPLRVVLYDVRRRTPAEGAFTLPEASPR
jgi:mannosyltransferase